MAGKARTRLLNTSSYVSIDTETTGLDTDWCEIIEVAGVKVVDGKVVGRFQELVRPEELPIPAFIEFLTGITSEMLVDARTIDEVLPEFIEFVGDAPVVGQNVAFDLRFIESYAHSMGIWEFNPIACDIMRMSRILFPEMPHHRLYDNVEKCKKIAGNAPDFGNAHRALADAEMTMWCYEVMRPIMTERYGDDPEREINRIKNAAKANAYKEYLANLEPTVDEIDEDNPFFGSNVCFTGALSSMTRKEAWQHVVNLGAVPQKSVTKKTDYLVVGSFDFSANLKGDKSSKLEKAEALLAKNGAPEIVSEEFFTQFIEGE